MPRAILIPLALVACSGADSEPSSPEPAAAVAPVPDPGPDRLADAQRAVAAVGGGLRSRLQEVMGRDGPEAAVRVCADEAPALTRELAGTSGVTVGRASLRLRNPANAPPDWVAAWLTAQGERPAAGVEGFARIDGEGDARVARVLKPVPVEAVCLTCHGPTDSIPAAVRAVLKERYPADAATGYALGDLRGVAWAEASITGAPGAGSR